MSEPLNKVITSSNGASTQAHPGVNPKQFGSITASLKGGIQKLRILKRLGGRI